MSGPAGDAAPAGLRADKWLWQARFFKTRALAAAAVSAGHVRCNGRHLKKPAQVLRTGDTLTFPQGRRVRVVRITGLPHRRGPACEAETLYDDLSPAAPVPAPDPGAPVAVTGRPTRQDRRAGRISRHGRLD